VVERHVAERSQRAGGGLTVAAVRDAVHSGVVAPEIVSFYRIDPWVRMRRALTFGSTVVTLGALVMAVSFLTHQSEHLRMVAAICGIGTVILGAASAVFGMQRVLRDDRCIVVRTDGLVSQVNGAETFMEWDSIASIRLEVDSGVIVVERRGEHAALRMQGGTFRGWTSATLAVELDGMRRKASFGMLRA
jgi:hypothetical protein